MWALDPSLLELLVNKLQPSDRIQFLFYNHPALCLVTLFLLLFDLLMHNNLTNLCVFRES
jgi:hypothetical protein